MGRGWIFSYLVRQGPSAPGSSQPQNTGQQGKEVLAAVELAWEGRCVRKAIALKSYHLRGRRGARHREAPGGDREMLCVLAQRVAVECGSL